MPSILKVDTIQESTSGGGVNFSHPAELANGTAAAPSLAFTSDTNTGLYRISEDKIGVAVNGTRVGEVGAGYGGFTGNVIQVINSLNSYGYSTSNSSNWTTYILSAVGVDWEISITPKYTTSKILLIYNLQLEVYASAANFQVGNRVSRKIGSGAYSEIYSPGDRQLGFGSGSVGSGYFAGFLSSTIYDSPNSTSQVSYKFPIRNSPNNGALCFINGTAANNTSSVTLLEIQQ